MQYLSLLRVPLVFFAIGVGLSWHPKGIRSLLRGTFDAKAFSVPAIIAAVLVYSGTLFLCAITVIEYAPARVGVSELGSWFAQRAAVSNFFWYDASIKNVWLLVAGLSLLPAILCTARVIYSSEAGRSLRTFLCLVVWITFGLVILACPPQYWTNNFIARILARVFQFDPRGYIDPRTGQPRPLHVYAAVSLIIIVAQLALYLAIVLVSIHLRKPVPKWLLRWDGFPVLYSVYGMLGLLCLLLTGLGFFLDRYGISLLLVLVVWRLLVWYVDTGSTVEFFTPVIELPSPREVLAANSTETGGRVIVVCASGGGIHAAAWTAKVLTGLEALHRGSFAAMVRVLSTVSGGSVGAMNFAGAYGPFTGQVEEAFLEYANTQSRLSSLPAALGGWFLFDVPRLFIPWLPSWLNRGWALERRWDIDGYYGYLLGLWGYQARLGRRPALLFNCTAVETGKPVVFGTSKLRPRVEPDKHRDESYSSSFHELTGSKVDLMVPTAARLSATFPFVSPACRVIGEAKLSPNLSYVDGGYYDNFGVATAIEFLTHALGVEDDSETSLRGTNRAVLGKLSPPIPIRKVLMIEIRAAATLEAKCNRVRFEQLLAPMRTILAVRSAAQRLRNNLELQFAKEVFAGRGVTMENVVFEYPDADIPLSWHLTEKDVTRIDEAWAGDHFAEQKQVVAEFCKDPVRLPLPLLQMSDFAASSA